MTKKGIEWSTLVILPLVACIVFLAANVAGFDDGPALWQRLEAEQDQDEALRLMIALALRGELDALDRPRIKELLDRLDRPHRGQFVYHFPQHHIE